MIGRRIFYNIKKIYYSFLDYISRAGLNFNYIIFILIAGLGVVFFSYNIYKTVNRAEENYLIKQEEQRKRDELKSELKDVDEELAYLNSQDARRNMAVEGYKMAAPGESLYEIKKDDVKAVYINEEELEPINLEDNKFWWEYLVFGRKVF